MADKKQSFQAGQTAGHAEEKSNVVIDKVKDAIGAGAGAGGGTGTGGGTGAGAGTTAQQAGQKISEATGGAVNVGKEKTGTNK